MAGGRFLEDAGRGRAHSRSKHIVGLSTQQGRAGCRQTVCAGRPRGAQLGAITAQEEPPGQVVVPDAGGRGKWPAGQVRAVGVRAGAQGGATLHLRATGDDAQASSGGRDALDDLSCRALRTCAPGWG